MIIASEEKDDTQTNKKSRVWIIDDDRSIRWVLEKALRQANLAVECYENASGIMELLAHRKPNAIISDIRMPKIDGLDLLNRINQRYPDIPVIIMTAHSDLDSAVSAYQGGAFEYLPKPFDVDDAIDLVNRAVDHNLSHTQPLPEKNEAETVPEIIGEAASMQEVFRAIGRLSRSKITVLITGQSGTGKELVASALHRHSPRHDKPFIAINTAAIPKDLLESELFGHERGAFTGAQSARQGRFEQADGGTLFLDEIGDMPSELQTRLLRVLADGEFYRVGGHMPVKVDVRIIAATHQNLEVRVKENNFREDLYHRLNVIRINMPPLKERREDISLLADYFLSDAANELNVEAKLLDSDTKAYLGTLDWPGNVRQLQNTCRWLTVMSPGKIIHLEDLPRDLQHINSSDSSHENWESALRLWADQKLVNGEQNILDDAVPTFEQIMIEVALAHTGGRRQDAAKLLGWGRNTLTRKIKEMNLESL